jgi:adenine-specific DNA-methyltransferase
MDLERIAQQIGKPYYMDEEVLIFNMDCRLGIDTMRATGIQIDTTITSPPYNIGKEYENVIPTTDYIDWLSQIILY